MVDERTAAGVGVVSAFAVDVLVVVPYLLADVRTVAVYYGGLFGPPLAGLFAAVAGVALLGAARGRTDPPVAAGVALVLAVLVVGLVTPWALGVSPALVGGMTTIAAFGYHRWAVVAAGLGTLASAAWFARLVV